MRYLNFVEQNYIFNSVELPTTAPLPTIAFPLINAQCLISASSPIIAGPFIYAVGATLADLATQIFSPLFSNLLGSNVLPSSIIKLSILDRASHGYVTLSNNFFAIVSSKLYKFFYFTFFHFTSPPLLIK